MVVYIQPYSYLFYANNEIIYRIRAWFVTINGPHDSFLVKNKASISLDYKEYVGFWCIIGAMPILYYYAIKVILSEMNHIA